MHRLRLVTDILQSVKNWARKIQRNIRDRLNEYSQSKKIPIAINSLLLVCTVSTFLIQNAINKQNDAGLYLAVQLGRYAAVYDDLTIARHLKFLTEADKVWVLELTLQRHSIYYTIKSVLNKEKIDGDDIDQEVQKIQSLEDAESYSEDYVSVIERANIEVEAFFRRGAYLKAVQDTIAWIAIILSFLSLKRSLSDNSHVTI